MQTLLKITGATILRNDKGTDSVILYTDLPSGVFPYEGTTSAEIKVASGGGEDWIKSNLPNVQYSVIDV